MSSQRDRPVFRHAFLERMGPDAFTRDRSGGSALQDHPVVITPCREYDPGVLDRAVGETVEQLGGIGRFVSRGDRVMLKPNFVCGRPAGDRPAQTHAAFIGAVGRLVRDAGGRPFVSDSPGWGSAMGVANHIGLLGPARRINMPIVEMDAPRRVVNRRGKVFRRLNVSGRAMDAEVIINLPKLKSHGQLHLSGAIKNMFGCVVGRRKAWWHFKAGTYGTYFHRMLVETYQLLQPALSLIDGIVAMEGRGPSWGPARELGVIIGGVDGAAVDRVMVEVVGSTPERYQVLWAARELGVGQTVLDKIRVVGTPIDAVHVDDWNFPRPSPIGFSLPRIVKGAFKQGWYLQAGA